MKVKGVVSASEVAYKVRKMSVGTWAGSVNDRQPPVESELRKKRLFSGLKRGNRYRKWLDLYLDLELH